MPIDVTLAKLAAIADLYADDKDGSFPIWHHPEFPQFETVTLDDCREIREARRPKSVDLDKLTSEERMLFDKVYDTNHKGLILDPRREGQPLVVLKNMGLVTVEHLRGREAGTCSVTDTDLGQRSLLKAAQESSSPRP